MRLNHKSEVRMETGTLLARWCIFSMLLVIALMLLDGKFLPSQMSGKVWLPGSANGAIWANLVLLPPALYIIGAYADQWGTREVTVALLAGMTISWLLFFLVYQHGEYDDGLSHPLSLAGVLFFLCGGAIYAALGLFFFCTRATAFDVLAVGALLLFYVPVANHLALDWLDKLYAWVWYPPLFATEKTPLRFIIGGDALVVVSTIVKLAW